MKKDYTTPEIELVVFTLKDVILNSKDEHLNPIGDIEDPDNDMVEGGL